MIKAVVFDLDGTLIDSTEAIVASFNYTFDSLGVARPPRQRIIDTIGYTLENQFRQISDSDPGEAVRVYRGHYAETAREATFLLPGAERSLERLRGAGMRLGFATSKQRKYAEMLLEHMGVLDRFECRIGPEDIVHPKPHPEALLACLERLELVAGEMVFVGDTSFDAGAAKAAGVRCICVTTGYETRHQLEALEPEAVFDSLDEVTDYLLAECAVPAAD